MEKLDYCLRCYFDFEERDWELIILSRDIWVFRCPKCHTLHTCFPDGTIRLSGQEANRDI